VLNATSALSQVEIEQLAGAQAERLLTPRAVLNAPAPAPPRPPEPTLAERLIAIDRRWGEYARIEKQALVADLLTAARKRFISAVSTTKDGAVRSAWDAMIHCEQAARP
jgi:hypothetical protein